MPISGSRYFNDPGLAAAASNLAGLFAPPSGADAAGWAAAGAKKAEAARLAALFDYQNSPEFNQQQFDRMGAAAGAWTPSQGYYAVDEGNAVARRGQDVTANTALSTNAADNARALEATRLTNAKDVTTSMLAPVAAGATRFVPPSIASMYDTDPTQVGVLSANQGEVVRAPNGQTIVGPAKPLSETEWNAQENARLLREGKITDQDLTDAILGKETPVKVTGSNGPVYQSPGAAVRTGAAAYDAPNGAIETQNYKAPDGTTGSAYFDPAAKQWLDTTTGQAIPPNSVTFSAGLTGGTTETGLGGKFTERDSVIQLAGENMKPGIAILNKAFAGDQSVSTGALMVKGVFGDNPAIRDIAQGLGIVNPVDQQILGGIDSVMNYLYLQTGAARTESEDTRSFAALVPLQSDTPENRQLKRDMFNQKAMSIINQAKDPVLRRTLTQAIQGIFTSPAGGNASTVPTGNTVAAPNTPADAAAPAEVVAPVTAPSPTAAAPPQAAVDFLKAHPDAAAAFDEKYGSGAAARVTGGQ